jgi:hypothetical protein
MEHAGVQLVNCEKVCKIDVQTAVSVQLRKQDTLDQPRRIRHTKECSCSNIIWDRVQLHGFCSLVMTGHMRSSPVQQALGQSDGEVSLMTFAAAMVICRYPRPPANLRIPETTR